jgi:hypothetical protein
MLSRDKKYAGMLAHCVIAHMGGVRPDAASAWATADDPASSAAAAAGEGAGCPLSQLVPSEASTPFLECFSFNSASRSSRGGGSWAEEEEGPDSAVFGGIRDFGAIRRRDRMQEELLSFDPSIDQDLVFGAGCEAVGGGGGHVHARRVVAVVQTLLRHQPLCCVHGGVALLKNVTA